MQNTGGKKRVGQVDANSDYLFGNFLLLPGFRSTEDAK